MRATPFFFLVTFCRSKYRLSVRLKLINQTRVITEEDFEIVYRVLEEMKTKKISEEEKCHK